MYNRTPRVSFNIILGILRNSGMNFNLEETFSMYRFIHIIYLYCLVGQAGIYSDVLECSPVVKWLSDFLSPITCYF